MFFHENSSKMTFRGPPEAKTRAGGSKSPGGAKKGGYFIDFRKFWAFLAYLTAAFKMAIFSLSRPPPGKFCKFWPKIDHFLTIFWRFSYLTAALEAFFGPPEIGPPGPGGQNDHFCHFQLEMTISRALWRPGLQKPSKTIPRSRKLTKTVKKTVFFHLNTNKNRVKKQLFGGQNDPVFILVLVENDQKWPKMVKNVIKKRAIFILVLVGNGVFFFKSKKSSGQTLIYI